VPRRGWKRQTYTSNSHLARSSQSKASQNNTPLGEQAQPHRKGFRPQPQPVCAYLGTGKASASCGRAPGHGALRASHLLHQRGQPIAAVMAHVEPENWIGGEQEPCSRTALTVPVAAAACARVQGVAGDCEPGVGMTYQKAAAGLCLVAVSLAADQEWRAGSSSGMCALPPHSPHADPWGATLPACSAVCCRVHVHLVGDGQDIRAPLDRRLHRRFRPGVSGLRAGNSRTPPAQQRQQQQQCLRQHTILCAARTGSSPPWRSSTRCVVSHTYRWAHQDAMQPAIRISQLHAACDKQPVECSLWKAAGDCSQLQAVDCGPRNA
jgi:hypothetical protein